MDRGLTVRSSGERRRAFPAVLLDSALMVLYHWARCSTCRQARRHLTERSLQVEERDVFADPLTESELEDLARRAGGLKALASTASSSFRARGLPLDRWSEGELRTAMLEDPHLLKRPILRRDDGTLLIGLPTIVQGVAA